MSDSFKINYKTKESKIIEVTAEILNLELSSYDTILVSKVPSLENNKTVICIEDAKDSYVKIFLFKEDLEIFIEMLKNISS